MKGSIPALIKWAHKKIAERSNKQSLVFLPRVEMQRAYFPRDGSTIMHQHWTRLQQETLQIIKKGKY